MLKCHGHHSYNRCVVEQSVESRENGCLRKSDNYCIIITQCGSTVYIGIAQVTRHQPCTFENSSFHLHYAFHFTFEEISVKVDVKGTHIRNW